MIRSQENTEKNWGSDRVQAVIEEPVTSTGPVGDIVRAKVFLAPMAGVTDRPFRILARRYGCRFAFTEMIDVNGIYYNNLKTLKMMGTISEEGPVAVQIVGADEKKILYAAKICEQKGFCLLDLNAGCPARKVTKSGKGSALLKDPVKLGRIVGMLVKNLSIPVTVKIRSGFDTGKTNYLEVAEAVASEGASAVCVHARTKEQMYRGKADHEVTRAIKEAVDIPVFASGSIYNSQDILDVMGLTGCDAVAVARGVLGRPWIFRGIYEHMAGYVPACYDLDDIKQVIIEHFSLALRFADEKRVFSRMYKHVCWYLARYKNLDEIMKVYSGLNDFSELKAFLGRLRADGKNRLSLA